MLQQCIVSKSIESHISLMLHHYCSLVNMHVVIEFLGRVIKAVL